MPKSRKKIAAQHSRFSLVLTRIHTEYDKGFQGLPEFVSLLQRPNETHWIVCPQTHGDAPWFRDKLTGTATEVRVCYVPADCHIEDAAGVIVKRGRDYAEIVAAQQAEAARLDDLASQHPQVDRQFLNDFSLALPLAAEIPDAAIHDLPGLQHTYNCFTDLLQAGGGYLSMFDSRPQMLHGYGGILQPPVVAAIKTRLSSCQRENVIRSMRLADVSPISGLIAELLA